MAHIYHVLTEKLMNLSLTILLFNTYDNWQHKRLLTLYSIVMSTKIVSLFLLRQYYTRACTKYSREYDTLNR